MNIMKKKIKNRKGFTLIELIVVIAILGILAAIIIPRLGGYTENAKVAADKEMAAVVANAAAMYHATNPDDEDISIKDLTDSKLLNTDDTKAKSDSYEDLIDTDIVLSGDEVTVTLRGKGTVSNYEIKK